MREMLHFVVPQEWHQRKGNIKWKHEEILGMSHMCIKKGY
jgi:hypothetical protein